MEKTTGLTHFIKSAGYSIQGLKSAIKYEAAFRHELAAGLILIPAALYLANDKFEMVLMIGSYLIVLVTELLNSALEAVVDRIGSERHELSGRAKDQGSAAVFVAIANCVMIWLILLIF
ncbi:diacylglycerol kinase [Basfia succiniciproducens]|uniref:Diacylglycerol kinase n=1 Tax=Basfia succiniciproducens TaxID=653940 RepID=A0A1G5AYD2_9PAST|nr:diacylglycerol kinase [Basfia succiniciproducens]QIM69640.1 diacylglycerol kinase [Basfia succiniciproducens]SCX82864.1 diacylglycerol kinase [Basfia succiniciproducens]